MPSRSARPRAQKFTPIRRQVLQALLSSHRPLGAYEVIDELAKSMPRPAPITVYRALDFLMENGLVHRIESRNAFLACAHDHDAAAMVAFLICEPAGRSAKFRRRRSRKASTPRRAPQALRRNSPSSKSPAPARTARRPHNNKNTAPSRITRINVFRDQIRPTASAGRPLSAGAVALMLMLCLSWGFNQIAVKLVLPDVPPMLQALTRSVGALPVLLRHRLVARRQVFRA